MDASDLAAGHPARLAPPTNLLGPLRLLRTIIRNPMEAWPGAIYRLPIVRWRAFGTRAMFVMDPELIREILVAQADAFNKGLLVKRAMSPVLGDAIFTADGAHWRWQRRAAAPMFRQEAISAFVPAMVAAAERAKERWSSLPPGAELNISHEMMRTTFEVVLETILASPRRMDVPRIEEAITRYLESIGWVTAIALLRLPPSTPFPGRRRTIRAGGYLRSIIADIVADCRAGRAGAGLPAQLMAAADPDTGRAMDDRDLSDNLLTFIAAGHETTAVALTWTLYLLSTHPWAEAKVAQEIAEATGGDPVRPEHIESLTFTRQVFMEAMRLYPPAAVLARSPVRDVQLGGETIPAGMQVYIPIYGVHRHQSLWRNPDAFDPSRFTEEAGKHRHRYAYMPFGAGPRICIGASFAMTEGVAILATLIRDHRFRLRPGYIPQLRLRATLRPAAGMPMTVERR
jgi:cytochrome P450